MAKRNQGIDRIETEEQNQEQNQEIESFLTKCEDCCVSLTRPLMEGVGDGTQPKNLDPATIALIIQGIQLLVKLIRDRRNR